MDELVDLLAGLGLEAYAERLDDFGIASVGDLGDEELITDTVRPYLLASAERKSVENSALERRSSS